MPEPHRRGLVWLYPWLLFVFIQSAGMVWVTHQGSQAGVYEWVDRVLGYESWAAVWGLLGAMAFAALATGGARIAYATLAFHSGVNVIWGLSFADWALTAGRPDSWPPAWVWWGVALASIMWVWVMPRRYVGRGTGA